MNEEVSELSRRELLALATAAGSVLLAASSSSAQTEPPELSEEEKRLGPYLLLTGAGATVSIDASKFETRSLILLAGNGAEKGSRLILRNAGTKSVRDLLLIAGPHVTLEI